VSNLIEKKIQGWWNCTKKTINNDFQTKQIAIKKLKTKFKKLRIIKWWNWKKI